jgi:3-methyladenine DNA glycosylase/8-oxoguanine DNA glycosylase
MEHLLTLQFTPTKPFDFELSLHKRAGWYWLTPFEIYESETLWTGMRLNTKPIGLKLQSQGTISKPKLFIEVFSKEKLSIDQKKKLRKFLTTALKLKQDLEGFYSFAQKFPVLKEATKSLYGMHTTSDPNLFHAAIRTVLSHMCRTSRAIKMLDCLFRNYGEKIKFDGKGVIFWPTKEKLNKIFETEFREKCNFGYRAKNLKLLVSAAVEGKLPEREELLKLSPEDAKKKLMEFKGIGEYSAEILSPHPGFPLDVWSVMIFWKLLGIKKDRPTREMIPKVKLWVEKNWGSWRSLAFTYILNDLENLKAKFKVDVSGTIADYIKEKKEARGK